jgi:hypothetical protein
MESENKVFLGAWPAHTRFRVARAANAENPKSELVLDLQYPTVSESYYIYIYYDSLMAVSFGNSAINDLYTADTPRA